MSRRVAPLLAFGALVAGAACVEIAAGPNGVVSIRLTPPPKAIIFGDTLRDSTGAVLRLQPVGFGENGSPVSDLAFRFVPLPVGIDTVQGKPVALLVDTTSGLVSAPGASSKWLDDSGRVAVTLGRLQIVDTFVIVPRPKRLTRVPATGQTTLLPDTSSLYFDCRNVGATVERTVLDSGLVKIYKGVTQGDITALGTRVLTGDSVVGSSIPVRRYLVQYTIESVAGKAPSTIPTATLPNGSTRQAIGLVTRGSGVLSTPDTPTNFDTTDVTGGTSLRLRIFPSALTPTLFPDTIRVVVRVLARLSRDSAITDTSRATVMLRRFTRVPTDSTPLTCPAS